MESDCTCRALGTRPRKVSWRLEGITTFAESYTEGHALDVARQLLLGINLGNSVAHRTTFDDPEMLGCAQADCPVHSDPPDETRIGPYGVEGPIQREDYCTCAIVGSGVCPRHNPEEVDKIRNEIQSAIVTDFKEMTGGDPYGGHIEYPTDPLVMAPLSQDRVNHPAHYLNPNARIDPDEHDLIEINGKMWRPVECIELLRHIKDPRLAHAFVYVWRICFGGKDDNAEDASKGAWFLNDYAEHPPER